MKNTNIFEKIRQLSDFYGYNSINDFALNGLEYKSSEKINRLKDPNNKPSFDIIKDISNKFEDVDINWLIDDSNDPIVFKTKKEENSNNILALKVNEPHTNNYASLTPAVVTIDSNNEDNIALVPIPLSAGYLKGYSDPNFIANLPTFRMPGLNHGIFRMFEVEGHSMFPTLPNKSYVVGQFVENWITGIKDNQIYAVISNEVEGGLVKRCINKIKKYNNLICKSDNRRDYPTQNISPESIKEIWEIKLHLNFQLPDPADIYDKIYDLEGEVSSLKEIVKRAKLI